MCRCPKISSLRSNAVGSALPVWLTANRRVLIFAAITFLGQLPPLDHASLEILLPFFSVPIVAPRESPFDTLALSLSGLIMAEPLWVSMYSFAT